MLPVCFILAAFPPSDSTEAEVALHREWSHAELVRDRGSGAIIPTQPPVRLLDRCPWRDRRADVPARRRFPARLLALRFDGLRAPPAMSRRFDRSQVPLLPVKNACSTERRTAQAQGSSSPQACGLPSCAQRGSKRRSNGRPPDRLRLR